MQTNDKAMREALKATNKFLDSAIVNGKVTAQDITALRNIVSAALAAPPRQCDVGTAEEQEVRFDAFCKSHGHGFDRHRTYACENCKFISMYSCELAWAQMPYWGGKSK